MVSILTILRVFLVSYSHTVLQTSESPEEVLPLYDVRHEEVVDGGCVFQEPKQFLKSLQRRYENFREDFAEEIARFPTDCKLHLPLNRTHLELRSNELAQVFANVWTVGVREVVLGNLIELWVEFIAGPLAVPGFLLKCQ